MEVMELAREKPKTMKWEKTKVNKVAFVFNGKTPAVSEQRNSGFPVLKIKDIDENGKFKGTFNSFVDEAFSKDYEGKQVKAKDTLILNAAHSSTHVGSKTYFAENEVENSIATGEWTIIRASDNVDATFLFYYFYSDYGKRAIRSLVKGIHLYPKDVAQLEISLPPLLIQQKIAALVDKADALRQHDQQLLAKYDELAQSVFYDMFGDPVKNEKGWEVKKLKDACIQINDGTHFSPPNVEHGIPYITAKHITREGEVDFYSNPTYISQEEHKKIYKRCAPVMGDILYIKDGATTGVAAINKYDFEFSILSSLALIKVNKGLLNNYYFKYLLNNVNFKRYLINIMSGAAIKRFTIQKIKAFNVPVPVINLQNQFATIIEKIEQQKSQAQQQLQKSEDLFQSLLQRAFKGEVA